MLKFKSPESKLTLIQRAEREKANRRVYFEALATQSMTFTILANMLASQFTKQGCRQRAFRMVHQALAILQARGSRNPRHDLFTAVSRIKPVVGFRLRKKRNKAFRLPYLLDGGAEWRRACREFAQGVRRRREPTLPERIAAVVQSLVAEDAAVREDLFKRKLEDQRQAVQNLMYFRFTRKWKFHKRRVT